MRFVVTMLSACVGKFGFSSAVLGKRLAGISSKFIASIASFSVAFTPISVSFVPQHAYAQEIIIDPSAPSTSLFSSGNGTPQINIATPQSGVSQNRFSNFNVGSDGLILNNSQAGGNSRIGGTVGANGNLATSGPATVILNEVTSANTSTLTGTTEVFGGRAAVIIANPNGIGCNGCSFINTNRTTLATGTSTVDGSSIGLRVTQGTLNIGRGGFTTEGAADLVGRHIIIDGGIVADDDLVVSGGAQQFNYQTASPENVIVNAEGAKKSPFAVDATEFGALTAGNIRIHGNEHGLGVNAYGDLNSAGDVQLNARGDVFYGNIQSGGTGNINALGGEVRQYGDARFEGDVTISGDSFTLRTDRKLETQGNVSINTTDFVVVVGEIAARDITINTAQSVTNNGFLLADGDLVVIAGDDIVNEREIATEYDVYYDPAIQQYLEAYQAQLLSDDADERALAEEFLARAAAYEIIQEYVKRGATLLGENVRLEANLDIDLDALANDDTYTESGDIRNIGGAIVGTRDVILRAGEHILNQSIALRDRLEADEGCTAENCGYRTNFHAGEILSGGNIRLDAGLNIENQASHIAAAGSIVANAGRDIINTLLTSQHTLTGTDETISVSGSRLEHGEVCEGGGDNHSCEDRYYVVSYTEDTNLYYNDVNTLIAPGEIVTLAGDIELNAERDFVSEGSVVSSGGDLNIDAGSQVILSSFSAVEESYEYYNRDTAYARCGGESGNCTSGSGTETVNIDGTEFITSASVLQGQNISVVGQSNISLLGARIFAAEDLDIESVFGSILVDSIDLPDEVVGTEFADVNFRELDSDAAARLFQDADLAQDFQQFIDDNPLLAAVDTLRRVESPNQIRDVVRSVGLQDGRSIFQDTLDESLYDLRDELEARFAEIDTEFNALNNTIDNFYAQFEADIANLQSRYGLSDVEINAEIQLLIDAEEARYNAELDQLEATRDAQIEANRALYEPNLTYQAWHTPQVCTGSGESKDCEPGTPVLNTYTDQTVQDQWDNADANVQANFNNANQLATQQRDLNILGHQATGADQFTAAAINADIAELEANLLEQSDLFQTQRNILFDRQNASYIEALEVARNIRDYEAQIADEGDDYIARGTVVEGEESAAIALANFGFDDSDELNRNVSIDLARDYGIDPNAIRGGLSSRSGTPDNDVASIIDRFSNDRITGDPSNSITGAGYGLETILYGDEGSTITFTDPDNNAVWTSYTIYRNADNQAEVTVFTYDDGKTREYFYGAATGADYNTHDIWYDANGRKISEATRFNDDASEAINFTYNADNRLEKRSITLRDGSTENTNYVYAANGEIHYEDNYYANGTRNTVYQDFDGSQSWENVSHQYNSDGQRERIFYEYDNQNTTLIEYDFNSNQEWKSINQYYNEDGNLTQIVKYNDDESYSQTVYDYGDSAAYSYLTHSFDKDRRRTNLSYTYDDGRFFNYQYDVNEVAAWDYIIYSYSAEGVYEKTTWNYDNGFKAIRHYDRANEHDWNTRTVRYNASGNFYNETYVADIESTIAEANYGKFFEETQGRFANAGGLAQLASTPRAILFADNDLSLTAGRFVGVEVEDKSFTNQVYNRPADLASTYDITNRSVNGAYDPSPEADASFPLFAEVVASVVTNDTPVSENQYTNSVGTEVHRKDYEDGTYSTEYTATSGVRFIYYHNSAGEQVALKYFYADGRVRDRVYAAANATEQNWQQLDAYYDAEGRLYVIDEYANDNSRTRTAYDASSTKAWDNYISSYDANGNITSSDVSNDNGNRYVHDFDVDNNEEWEITTTTYIAGGQLYSIKQTLDDGGEILTSNDYADTQAWARRTITTAADGTTSTSLIDDLDPSITRTETQLRGAGDIYVAGATTISAGNDITINASRRLGILGAVNTNFRLAPNSHTSFDQIGENLQLGTLYRETDEREVGILLDADGNPILDPEGNTIRVNAEDATEGNLDLADQTRNYRLTNTVINAGNDLSLNASSNYEASSPDIVNFGGSLIAGENAYITSDGDIRNEVLRRNFTLTQGDGCVGRACGGEGHDYKPGEILAGSGLIIASGGSVTNYGGNIGAAGAILISAEEDIINDAITSQYLYHYINSSSAFGLKRRKEILRRAIIQEGNISSTYGSITLDAGRDIKNHASLISAGGNITLDADGDIELYAKAEEVHNYVKRRGLGFLSISSETTRFNEFGTAFSTLEGNNIYATAGNNLIGTGTIANAAADLVLNAGNNVTFDAHQNLRYRETEGWSFGITFPGSNIIAALVEGGDLGDAFDAYIGSNPLLAAVHQLSTADNSDQTRSALLGIGITGLQTAAGARRRAEAGNISNTDALAAQFNPFAGGPLDFTNVGAAPPVEGAPQTVGTEAGQARSFLDGITFRFSAYESREEWTESYVSKLTAGQDLDFSAGNNVQLLGGTIATAGRDGYLYAEQDILVSALADTRTSQSSSWGASVGFSGGNVTIGGHAQSASSDAQLFTNAGLTAGATLDIYAGRDNTFAGANVAAGDISIYSGRDLVVQSRQNVSNSESSGWNASVTFSPTGVPVGASFGLSEANSNREYTDTPTTIIGENSLDIYTGERTWLVGAVLDVTNSVDETQVVSAFDFDGRYTGEEARGLSLNTGSFVFDNLNDVDQAESISGGVNVGLSTNEAGNQITGVSSFGTNAFGYSYHDRQGITFATVGEGIIRVRDVADGEAFDFRDLNRDADDVQRLIRDESFEINLPAIELSALSQNLSDARELFAGISEERALARQFSDRTLAELDDIARTTDNKTLRNLINSPGFRAYVTARRTLRDTLDNLRPGDITISEDGEVTYNFMTPDGILHPLVRVYGPLAQSKYDACLAGGGSSGACKTVYYATLEHGTNISFDIINNGPVGTIISFVFDEIPVIGDGKGIYECFDAPSGVGCSTAAAAIFIPGAGKLKIFVKRGDETIEITKRTDDSFDVSPVNDNNVPGGVNAPNSSFDFAETGSGTHLRRTIDVDGNRIQINSGHGYNRSHSGGDVRDSGLSMNQIDNAIANDIARNIDVRTLPTVPARRDITINIDGYSLTYRTSRLSDGTVTVSTYFPGP